MFMRSSVSCLVAIFLTFGIVSAQIGGSGSIQGTVTDPSGAVIATPAVTAVNNATGVRTTRQTTTAGFYVLTPLPAGEYKVTVSAPGFQGLTHEHISVNAL